MCFNNNVFLTEALVDSVTGVNPFNYPGYGYGGYGNYGGFGYIADPLLYRPPYYNNNCGCRRRCNRRYF